ncbi:MAG: sugar phosphate isomerase/epimerase [Acetatifactor sp.]
MTQKPILPNSERKKTMTDLGMPTLIEIPEPKDCAALCAELGLQFVELNMNMPQYQIHSLDADRLAALAEKYGIYYTIHLDENLNVSDFNPHVAEAYLETVRETVHIARRLHIPVLNMHLSQGVYFTLPDRRVYLFDTYSGQYLQSLLYFREECERQIGSCGLRICVENSSGYTDFQRQALALLLESPVFALTFDIGHNHCVGGGDESVILQHADRLCHFHFHDAAGKKDHLPLGTGEIELSKYLRLAHQTDSRIVLETKTVSGLRESVGWMRRAARS